MGGLHQAGPRPGPRALRPYQIRESHTLSAAHLFLSLNHRSNRFGIYCCGPFDTKVYSEFPSGAWTGFIDRDSVLGEGGGCPPC